MIVSTLVGTTTLFSIFLGPIVGRLIDRTQYKFMWLLAGQTICGLLGLGFGNLTQFRPLITPALVLAFAATYNFNTIIINQYLIPLLQDDFESSVTNSSKVTGLAVLVSGLSLAFFFDRVEPILIYVAITLCYLLSALSIVVYFKRDIFSLGDVNVMRPTKSNGRVWVRSGVFNILSKNWLLSLSMCVIALTETSFRTNFDVVVITLGVTPYAVVFLFGAVSGVIESMASFAYPVLMKRRGNDSRWFFFLFAFFVTFFTGTICSFYEMDTRFGWFIPALALGLEVVGVWWAIFIATRVRSVTEAQSYGETMAAFRVPRSLITFVGVTGVGAALQYGEIWWLLLFNSMLIGILLVIHAIQFLTKTRCARI